MRTIISVIFLLSAFVAPAQRTCVSHEYHEQLKQHDATVATQIEAAENFQNQRFQTFSTPDANVVITIPVVVHILYNQSSQNISDAQIKSQIDALNRDFRKLNADTANIPQRFKNFAADVQIEFVLAKADPKGRPTNGIVRKPTTVADWKMDDKIKFNLSGGSDAWDSKSYLNIWVGNMKSLLGYSSAPGSPEALDGIVVNTTAFGTFNTAAPFHLGRTAVHEVGHWLGLKHLWGDAYCGDDLVDDTPKQAGYTSGCPTGFRSTCNNAPIGDMYMNYMDFTNDACIYLFTEGQKHRMRKLFFQNGARYSLLSSKGLMQPWNFEMLLAEVPVKESINVFPNPATNEIMINVDFDQKWVGRTVNIINSNGVVIRRVLISTKIQKIDISSLSKGIYFLQGIHQDEKMNLKFIKF